MDREITPIFIGGDNLQYTITGSWPWFSLLQTLVGCRASSAFTELSLHYLAIDGCSRPVTKIIYSLTLKVLIKKMVSYQ